MHSLVRFMKQAKTPLFLFLVLALVGCSSSRPTANTRDSTSQTTQQTSSSAAEEAKGTPETAPSSAPRDWYHVDRVPRSGPGLDTRAAYRDVLKNRPPKDTVQVAIIDSGVDLEHEDLATAFWRNADEIPSNNKDDDGNGYIDDVHGWNFIGGPDGKNVNQDTYELTRLYVDLREQFAGVDSADVEAKEHERYRRYLEMKQKFQEKRKEAQRKLANVQRFQKKVDRAKQIFKEHLQVDSLSQEGVTSTATTSQRLAMAQKLLEIYYRQGPETLLEYREYLERQVEYNYNPDFNPRSIVGDDYSNKSERHYGNNILDGPDPSHGTHVAGVVGASRDNQIGIDGIARGVELLPIRTVPNGDERDKDVANAIRYAVDNGADVINMSFGKDYSPHKEVVDAAVQHADSMGVLMIHAAGNDGANTDSTDNYPTPRYEDGGRANLWIEVGASSWKGGRELAASFSNYGAESVDVFAPGHSIYSTVPNDKYDRNDGTSMAAPMVSGVAALLMAHYPSLSAAQVRTIILESATSYQDQTVNHPGGSGTVKFGQLSRTGAIVNAHAAVQRASQIVTSTE